MDVNLQTQIANLPKSPGVYFFKDALGNILYIGKAAVLGDRVRSYLSPRLAEERGFQMVEMVNKVKVVEIRETRFEVEALLLEAKLIRRHKPPYNIRLRDDKSFAVIAIDRNFEFPQIRTAREVDVERICQKLKRERSLSISQKIANIAYFGPYPSSGSAKLATRTLRRVFKFRDCSSEKFHHYQQIGRGCLFASINLCDAPCVGNILKSDYNRSINNIQEFLRGNRTKVIQDIEVEMKKQTKNENFERAALLRDQIFALSKIQMQAKISVRAESIQPVRPGKNIKERTKNKVLRIEAFDISNISGDFAVGAMVVGFIKDRGKTAEDKSVLRFAKQFYRRFKIRTVAGVNDLAMMKEVLERRFRHLGDQSEDWVRPDLIFIDGGWAHLRVAEKLILKYSKKKSEVSSQKSAQGIPIIAVAKGRSRKKVDLCFNKNIKMPIDLSKLTKIAETMREEVHRFAIGYYRTLHRKRVVGESWRK